MTQTYNTRFHHTQQIVDLVQRESDLQIRLKTTQEELKHVRKREKSNTDNMKAMSVKICELTQRVNKLVISLNTAESAAEEARQATKQAERKKEKMSKSFEAIKLLLHTQRIASAEHKRMSTQFTKVEKERDKAQEEVVKLTEKVVTLNLLLLNTTVNKVK